jgi:hypothetical protein
MIDLTPILEAVVSLAVVVITGFVVPAIRNRVNASKLAEVLRWVEIAVKAAEQIYAGTGHGNIKKAYVRKFLNDKGLTYDDELIEAAVSDLYRVTLGVWESGVGDNR